MSDVRISVKCRYIDNIYHSTMENRSVDKLAEASFAFANAARDNKSLTQQSLKSKLRRIDKDISMTKQNVVKHVLKARALEKERTQAIAIHESLRGHFDAQIRTSLFASHIENIKNGLVRLDVTANDLRCIEIASGIREIGIGSIIKRCIGEYTDTTLENTLSLIKFEELSSSFFCRIAIAASNGALNMIDALKIFKECYRVYEGKVLWDQLTLRLRRKIFILRLAISLGSSSQHGAPVPPLSGTLSSWHSLVASDASQPHPPRNRQLASSTSHRDLNQKTRPLNEKDRLLTSLQKSKNKQLYVSDKISSTISSILGSNSLPMNSFHGHLQAMLAAKKLQLEKLNAIYLNINRLVSKSAFLHWRKYCQFQKAELICRCFLKHYAAFRMFTVMELAQIRSLYFSMGKYKAFIGYYQSKEQLAATLEIQRYWRGGIARLQCRRRKLYAAATNIQKIVRRHLVRKVIVARRRLVLMKSSVRSIETVWKRFRWKRTLKKLFQLQKLNRQATKIQALLRGHRGRVRFMRLYVTRRKMLGALAFQCLWRRYRATVHVNMLRTKRRRNLAAICIQKRIRGFQARRRFAVRIRVHRCAILIQYCCICYKARVKVTAFRRLRGARLIQRVARGRAGRRRAANYLAAKHAKERLVELALRTISAVVLGYRTRRVWGPVVAAHMTRRSNAALIMQVWE